MMKDISVNNQGVTKLSFDKKFVKAYQFLPFACGFNRVKSVAGMSYNGPAIKCVNVAERMKAGAEKLSRGKVPVPAEKSKARRAFCRPGTEFD
jgi:hypothetical protein